MENYCGSCGAPVQENYNVCGNCGTPVAQAPQAPAAPQTDYVPYQQPAEMPNNKPEGNKKILTLGAAAVAIIVIIAIIAGIAGGGYKKPIKDFAKGFEKDDFDLFIGAYSELYLDVFGSDVFENYMNDYFDDFIDKIEDECGDDYKVNLEIKDKEKCDKDDIEDFVEDMEKIDFDYDADDIKALYELDVEITAEGDDGDYEILDTTVFVAKVDGKWGIVSID